MALKKLYWLLTHIESYIRRMGKAGMSLDYQKVFLKVYLKDFHITATEYILNQFYE